MWHNPPPSPRGQDAPLLALVMRFLFWGTRNSARRAQRQAQQQPRSLPALLPTAPPAPSIHLPVTPSPIGLTQATSQDFA